MSASPDFYLEIYSNQYVNFVLVGLYFLGLFACLGLAFVIWFERSGQAGPFRTVLNQIVSQNIGHLIVFYTIPFGIHTIRILTGPLPLALCQTANLLVIFNGINVILLSTTACCLRFVFIIHFKSLPVMNDHLMCRIITNCIFVWSLVACIFKFFHDTRLNPDIVSFLIAN